MATYKPLQSVVLTSATSSVTFSGIDQSYSDLILTCNSQITTGTPTIRLQFNSDTGSNYSATIVYGDGSSPGSVRVSNEASVNSGICLVEFGSTTIHINNYSNTTTYKTVLCNYRGITAAYGEAGAKVGLWRNTAAISTITIFPSTSTFAAGSTFSLYGIKSGAPQALGGDLVTTDGNYWYHTFRSTQTFTPLKTLSVDYLVVAGGGGGGGHNAGGGGAGGLRSTVTATGGGGSLESPTSVFGGTSYAITVGAGGAGGQDARGTAGSNSVFSTITSNGGAGGGGSNSGQPAVTGGSGGGGTQGVAGSAGTANQGSAGGNSPTANNSGGGGGGAGATGSPSSGVNGGNGGNGVATSISGSSVTYAGGGGGSSFAGSQGSGGSGGGGNAAYDSGAGAGTVNLGGGGGASNRTTSAAGAGGSGIVIVRYAV
jgi:hypothetical protein